MKKILLTTIVSAIIVSGADYTVTITGKGKFGDELKALIEKYKNSGDIKITEAPATQVKQESIKEQISNFFFEKKKKESENEKARKIALGKKIYTQNCISCHGSKGLVKAYGRSSQIAKLSKDDFIDSIKAYEQSDSDETTNQTMIMKPYADMLTTDQAEAVYEYLKSIQ